MNPITEGHRITTGYDYFAKGFSKGELSEAYYRLIADKRQEALLFETATITEVDEVYNPGEEENFGRETTWESDPIMEAIRVRRYSRTEKTMTALVRVFNTHLKDSDIEALPPQVGKPKKSGLFASVTVQIPFSDGQVISIVFHSPGNNKMKIQPDDEIIAFRWILNKRDITHVVSPEGDAEVSLQEIGKRTAQLVEKNSARFQATQKDIVEQKKKLEETKAAAEAAAKQHDEMMVTLQSAQDSGESLDAQAVNLKNRIEKQKAFNEDLQGKIDALKAKKTANDGKATGGGTPKTEAEIKAEQERADLERKRNTYATELIGRGFIARTEDRTDKRGVRIYADLPGDPMTFYDHDDAEIGVSINLDPGKQRFEIDLHGRPFLPKGKLFKARSVAGIDAQWAKALKAIDSALAEVKEYERQETERVRAAFETKKSALEQELVERGFAKETVNGADSFLSSPVNGKRFGASLDNVSREMGYVAAVWQEENGEETDSRQFISKTIDGLDEQIQSALSWIDEKLAQDAKDREAAEFLKQLAEREQQVNETNRLVEVGAKAVPGIRLGDAEAAGRLWEMKERGEFSQEDWDKYVADLKASNKIAAPKPPEPEPEPKPAEPAAVGVLNDILAGKYDDDSNALGDALDKAAENLEKEGKIEEYDSLLNQCADYLTEILKKEAA